MISLLFILSSAFAVSVKVATVACPLGNDSARVFIRLSENKAGGFDSDLASYSSNGQYRQFAVSTCYKNLYSAYGRDMEKSIPKKKIQKVEETIAAVKNGFSKPNEPTVWERYEIAAAIYRTLGQSNFELANIYMEASWTARDTIVGFHHGLNGPTIIHQTLTMGNLELDKKLSSEQRKNVLFNLARVAHRGGFSKLRDKYLKEYSNLSDITSKERKDILYFQKITQEIEPKYQQKAILALQAAESEKLSPRDRIKLTYWLADLHRRNGRYKVAHKLYQQVANQEIDKQLQGMALYFTKPSDFLEPK